MGESVLTAGSDGFEAREDELFLLRELLLFLELLLALSLPPSFFGVFDRCTVFQVTPS